ncbi:protein JASON isoform X3 [Selaginella moellendorffii]|uniref:protein JASON isoform X3 n=1 Tax=Selaginella moellendorffii TaxID=88036 RepID=UPI000D1CB3F2|nr:protein JASON isoform X3 [Selaginella moellendorffii]|eukprot:XP_024524186.1 protein JASON isoform X3 [Selaginella moellendorffii]
MRVGLGHTGIDKAMRWLFGCFSSRKERPNRQKKPVKLFATACQALLQKASSRPDKAQVLPDSGLENDEKGISRRRDPELIKARDKLRAHDDPEAGLPREDHNKEAFHSAAHEGDGDLSVPAESSIHGKDTRDDYLSIDSVFPASLFSDESFKKTEVSEDSTSLSSETRSTQTQMSFDEKPIMGLVAADWLEPDTSEVKSYKAWDGKGIPNSPSKYKEDQTINFQTISFEARLERALAAQSVMEH